MDKDKTIEKSKSIELGHLFDKLSEILKSPLGKRNAKEFKNIIKKAVEIIDKDLRENNKIRQLDLKNPKGFYSPDHMISNALRLLYNLDISNTPQKDKKAEIILDSINKLFRNGTIEMEVLTKIPVGNTIVGRSIKMEKVFGEYPNLIIPSTKKLIRDNEGAAVLEDVKQLVRNLQIKKGAIIEPDIENIRKLIEKIKGWSAISTIQPHLEERKEIAPSVQVLLLINLELLGRDYVKYKGKILQSTLQRLGTFQLIRGLISFNYEDEAREIYKKENNINVPKSVTNLYAQRVKAVITYLD